MTDSVAAGLAIILVVGVIAFLISDSRRRQGTTTVPIVPMNDPQPPPPGPQRESSPAHRFGGTRLPHAVLRPLADRSVQDCPVTQSPFRLGRSSDNDMVFRHERVSRHHAEVRYENGGWFVEDVGSANGVFVNERRVSGARLAHGDVIDLGPFRLEFQEQSGERESDEGFQDNRFEFLEEIGRGGMAVVYRARLISSGRIVALKMPRLEFDEGNDDILARFRAEVDLTSRLEHPNIVRAFHQGHLEDGRPYLTMEYLPGGTLRRRMTPDQPLPEGVIRAAGAQIADGLHYAHAQRVVHRDLKPENVLLDGNGHAKLSDFGIALVEGKRRMTQVGPPVGTVHYMSPEQVAGAQPTGRSDLYALGCVLHEMATGRCPFEGAAAAIVYGHAHKEAAPVRSVNSSLSPEIDGLITALLNKQPERRPNGAAQVSAVLRGTRLT